MAHIEIVCTGNICRSPLVAALIRRELAARDGYADWVVLSSGTRADRGDGASQGSLQMALEAGLDLSGHAARSVTREIMEAADLIICMTSSHKAGLVADFGAQVDQVFLLSEIIGRKYDIPDPYGEPIESYRAMSKEVTKLVVDGLPRIIELARQQSVSAVRSKVYSEK